MKQTGQYGLNLFEGSDRLRVGPVNENTEKLEAALLDAIEKLTGTIETKTKIANGTYTGTGTYGADNPNSLTFGFMPQLVVIMGCRPSGPGILGLLSIFMPPALSSEFQQYTWFGSATANATSTAAVNYGFTYSFGRMDGLTLSWYHLSNADSQLNRSSEYPYHWVAIG